MASAASLLGTWTSVASIGTGPGSCTNFQWALTGQQGNNVSGTFSAVCASMTVSGTISGQVDGNEVPYQVSGSVALPVGPCGFAFSGTARIEGDALRVPYSGTTCLGPMHGEEVLRRPPAPAPPPPPAAPVPPPSPEPPPPAPESGFHVGPGPLSEARAGQVVYATRDEYPWLVTPRATEGEGLAAAEELLRRMIWHLQLAGFQAGRQRNPSGIISKDKLTVQADGVWRAYDVVRAVGTPGMPTEVIFLAVFPASPVADNGIPD
jgi:hypothetical protein